MQLRHGADHQLIGAPPVIDTYIPVAKDNLLDLYRLDIFTCGGISIAGFTPIDRIEFQPLP